MVIAYHFIFSAYGFWLPNDPRGSWSETIRVFDLLKYGPATKVTTTRSLASKPHDRKLRAEAKQALKHPPACFSGPQALAIAQGFEVAQNDHGYSYLALAILPDHVHLIIERHPRDIDDISRHLKARATSRMSQLGIHPLAQEASDVGRIPSPWSRGYWCPFIRDPDHLAAAIRYVKNNPAKSGLRPQHWRIVNG